MKKMGKNAQIKGRRIVPSLLLLLFVCGTIPPYLTTIGISSTTTLEEYGNRVIPIYPEMNLSLYYTWINLNDTRLLFFAPFSDTYPSPILPFIGQDYPSLDGSRVFVGHSFFLFEVYNDTNGNRVPDVESMATPIESEIQYNLEVNASESFEWVPVAKYLVNSIAHYNWSVTYRDVQAILVFPEDRQIGNITTNIASEAYLDELSFAYDFSLNGSISSLKADVIIGNTTVLPHPVTAEHYNASITNMSLSTVYSLALTSTSTPLFLVNNQPYDSRNPEATLQPANISEIHSRGQRIYEMLFGANYTLYTSTKAISLPSITAACPSSSLVGINPGWRISIELMQSYLTAISANVGLPSSLSITPDLSPLLYRICYPQWQGFRIDHDPIYKAFIGHEISYTYPIIIPIAIGGSILLLLAVISLRQTRRRVNQYTTS